MSELNFDKKTKEELEAIAAKEAEEARIAQEKADAEAAEAAAAKKAAEKALAKKIAEEAKAPVNNDNDDLEARIEEAWKQQAKRSGYPNRPRPENWGGHIN